jgi:hypothetical protein
MGMKGLYIFRKNGSKKKKKRKATHRITSGGPRADSGSQGPRPSLDALPCETLPAFPTRNAKMSPRALRQTQCSSFVPIETIGRPLVARTSCSAELHVFGWGVRGGGKGERKKTNSDFTSKKKKNQHMATQVSRTHRPRRRRRRRRTPRGAACAQVPRRCARTV